MIIVLFGQPHSGKTTIAEEVIKDLPNTELIDGDRFRAVFKNTYYSKEGRIKNIVFAQQLAQFCHTKGFDVVVSLVSPYKEVRESFKEKMKNNICEIYVHTTDIRGREDFHVKDYEVPTDEFIEVE